MTRMGGRGGVREARNVRHRTDRVGVVSRGGVSFPSSIYRQRRNQRSHPVRECMYVTLDAVTDSMPPSTAEMIVPIVPIRASGRSPFSPYTRHKARVVTLLNPYPHELSPAPALAVSAAAAASQCSMTTRRSSKTTSTAISRMMIHSSRVPWRSLATSRSTVAISCA